MKGLSIPLALIFVSYITFAGVVSETTLKSLGNNDFYISGVGGVECKTFEVPSTPDVNGQAFGVISVRAEFTPQEKSSSGISVFWNDDIEKLAELRHTDFKSGVVRLYVPGESVRKSNNIRFCGRASSENSSVTVLADSGFGVYTGPFFPQGKGLKLELETYSPFVSIPFTVDAVARNYGVEDADVMLTYRKNELEENTPEVSVLKGETSKKGVVPKCAQWDAAGSCAKPGEYRISYSIVANKAVPFTLLPAVMSYVNVFGEEETILSNRPNMGAIELPQKISVKVMLENDRLFSGDKIPVKVRVQNISRGRVEKITVTPRTGLEILGEPSREISALEPGQSADLVFNAKGSAGGNYAIGCSARYESREMECETTSVTIESGIPPELIASIIFALISIAVFAYFYFKKD